MPEVIVRYGNGTRPYNTQVVENRIFRAQKAVVPSQADRFIAHEIALAIRAYLGKEQQPVTPEAVDQATEKILIDTGNERIAVPYIQQRHQEESRRRQREAQRNPSKGLGAKL